MTTQSTNMVTTWRVILNSKLWNQKKYEEDFHSQPSITKLAQSKGRCRMINCPKKYDIVYFVCKGKIVMKGVLDSDGFLNGTEHQTDSYNIGNIRRHAIPPEFAWIVINEVGLSIPIRRTGQRTWAKMPTN
jgi:hypothetical protein